MRMAACRIAPAALAGVLATAACAPLPRAVDPEAARVTTLAVPLPPGRAWAHFALDTGADQAGGARREAGLVLVVRAYATEERRTIASCARPSIGSALGERSPVLLDFAFCDGEYRLQSDAGRLWVVRIGPGNAERTVVDLALPAGVGRAEAGEGP